MYGHIVKIILDYEIMLNITYNHKMRQSRIKSSDNLMSIMTYLARKRKHTYISKPHSVELVLAESNYDCHYGIRYYHHSSNVNNSNITKKGPIPINKTPRAKAAANVKILTPKSPSFSPIINSNTTSNSINSSYDNLSYNNHSSKNNNHSDHHATHYMKGGIPSDPIPPPFQLSSYGQNSLYTLVLLRHGESEWNEQNLYTGWCDVNLTPKGIQEAKEAGQILSKYDIQLDHVFTSVLKRAVVTTNLVLSESNQHYVPITKSWRLNERHYGALQGYNKDTAYSELGINQELVMEMRRSYTTRPPLMKDSHPYWHGHDRRYKELTPEQIDATRAESLYDTAQRIIPFYQSIILPSLEAGNKCCIVSHANTLRTLIKHIDCISDEDIKGMSIPTGIPLLYRLDKNFKPVDPDVELEFKYMVQPKGYTWGTSRQHGFHGVYLGNLERLQDIQRKRDISNRDWQRIILRNIAKTLDESSGGDGVISTRQLSFQIQCKLTERTEFRKMVLLIRMRNLIEDLYWRRKQRYLTMDRFEFILNKVHLDAEGHVVEPFEPAGKDGERREREYRQKEYEMLALDLEMESLIK